MIQNQPMQEPLLTVLMVDDDVNILHGFARAFRKYNCEFFTAQSAEEARDSLMRSEVDVVISDEFMKAMRGTELLTWVSEHFPDTLRILLTGEPNVESMDKAINQAQVHKCLFKPVSPNEVAEVIVDALGASIHPNKCQL